MVTGISVVQIVGIHMGGGGMRRRVFTIACRTRVAAHESTGGSRQQRMHGDIARRSCGERRGKVAPHESRWES